jgi:hypothetical protein
MDASNTNARAAVMEAGTVLENLLRTSVARTQRPDVTIVKLTVTVTTVTRTLNTQTDVLNTTVLVIVTEVGIALVKEHVTYADKIPLQVVITVKSITIYIKGILNLIWCRTVTSIPDVHARATADGHAHTPQDSTSVIIKGRNALVVTPAS